MMQTCPNGIKKTYIVSTPRSGHHLLVRGLEAAANHKLVYSENYNCKHNFTTCDFVNLQKDHDFELDLDISKEFKYVVLWRPQAESLHAWYNATESNISLSKFIKKNGNYFDRFAEKWLKSELPNVSIFFYADWIQHKRKTVKRICSIMGINPDLEKLFQWELDEDYLRKR